VRKTEPKSRSLRSFNIMSCIINTTTTTTSFEPDAGMLHYTLCLSYHDKTEAVLFAYLSSGWATTSGRLLDPKVENSIKCLSQGHSNALPHRELSQGFATFRLLAQRLLDSKLVDPGSTLVHTALSLKVCFYHCLINFYHLVKSMIWHKFSF